MTNVEKTDFSVLSVQVLVSSIYIINNRGRFNIHVEHHRLWFVNQVLTSIKRTHSIIENQHGVFYKYYSLPRMWSRGWRKIPPHSKGDFIGAFFLVLQSRTNGDTLLRQSSQNFSWHVSGIVRHLRLTPLPEEIHPRRNYLRDIWLPSV